MRKVKKDFSNVPPVLRNATCDALIADALIQKGKHAFKTEVYGHEEVRRALNGIYNGKCAFCETDTSAGATMQVEHYRPKARVTGATKHPGYYWLGYEWSNLLLACSRCNSRKRNRFPVAAARIKTAPLTNGNTLDRRRCYVLSADLESEQPQLVNPETDPDPMRHFRFQADGRIEYRTTMGQISIDTCNLNRGALVINRRKTVYDRIFNKILKHFGRFKESKIHEQRLHVLLSDAIEDLIDLINHSNQYSEFAKTCWYEFDNFFIARFQSPEQERLQAAYDEMKHLYEDPR